MEAVAETLEKRDAGLKAVFDRAREAVFNG
jgi:hypothetical protein